MQEVKCALSLLAVSNSTAAINLIPFLKEARESHPTQLYIHSCVLSLLCLIARGGKKEGRFWFGRFRSSEVPKFRGREMTSMMVAAAGPMQTSFLQPSGFATTHLTTKKKPTWAPSRVRRSPAVVVAASVVPVSPEFGYVVLTASASAILTQWQMFQVPGDCSQSVSSLCRALCIAFNFCLDHSVVGAWTKGEEISEVAFWVLEGD